ncbi:MAG TPA: 30S ribosome-binding factor RbfA [Candidatus Latescibacteria bacterium]|nr:30S ribosome-binding factor RbfA [Candidatus Latescibacterota bacterium]
MNHIRIERINGLIRDELSSIIKGKIGDPRIGFVTITRVDVSNDLKRAKVFVSVFGSLREKEETINGLNWASKFIRGQLGLRIRLKRIPEIVFYHDDSIEHGSRINAILDQLAQAPIANPELEDNA